MLFAATSMRIQFIIILFALVSLSSEATETTNTINNENDFKVTSEMKVIAESIEQSNLFGGAVSLYENRALISAESHYARGYAFIFEFDTSTNQWIEKKKLWPQLYSNLFDRFSQSVSLHGNLALIGAPGDDEGVSNSGGAYIFKYDPLLDDWDELPRLYASDRGEGDNFGTSVSIHGDKAIIGAAFDDDESYTNLGSAYIFQYDSENDEWTETIKLLPSNKQAELRFGESVSINGNWAFVGARLDNTNGLRTGVVYVYEFNEQLQQWQEKQKLYSNPSFNNSMFGESISTNGTRLLVGSPYDRDNGIGSGAAYIYEYDTNADSWIEVQKLSPDDGVSSDAFGISVNLNGEKAVIGAFRDDDNGDETGSAYVFGFDGKTWSQKTKLSATDATESAQFGQAVAINKDNILIGAHKDDEHGHYSGAAYIYSTDLIFSAGMDELTVDCSNVTYPPGLSQVIGIYRDFNSGNNFGETTNTALLANVNTSDYLVLSDFSMPTPDFRRRMIFNNAPTNVNLMADATVSISECPGDFTAAATCTMPVNNQSVLFFSNITDDENHPSRDYCILDSEKTYFYNLIMSLDPFNTEPTCNDVNDTECAAFAGEGGQ